MKTNINEFRSLSRVTLHVQMAFLLTFVVLATPEIWAQANVKQSGAIAPSPTFEVATIKPRKNQGGFGVGWFPGGSFRGRDATVKDLIRLAYDPDWSSTLPIYGGPPWAGEAHFDIIGKIEEPIPAEWSKIPGAERDRLTLQALLVDRFKLKIHHETRELHVYVLTVANGGPKITPTTHALTATDTGNRPAFGAVRSLSENWGGTRKLGAGHIVAQRETMSMLVSVLQIEPEIEGRGIVDKTGLAAAYDFTLQWLPENAPSMPPGGNGLPPADSSPPSLFTALQEQLGLKLVVTKASRDVIVIDSVEMPTEN